MKEYQYYDCNGISLGADEIREDVEAGKAVIFYSNGDGKTSVGFFDTPEEADEAAKIDTRGECGSVWDETWAELCTDANRALKIMRS